MSTKRRIATIVMSLAVLTMAAFAGAADGPGVPRVTLIGDSGLGALLWEKDARGRIGRGLDLRTEIRTCRKLATDSCFHQGDRPPNALETVKSLGRALGTLIVIQVGYNDQPDRYADGLDRVMRAAVDTGVEKVVWVTLRASRQNYVEINAEIAAGARRWPQLVVADWDATSRDRDWFHDGVHMNAAGAEGFATFLRPRLVDACGAACAPGGSMLAIRTGALRVAKVGQALPGDHRVRGRHRAAQARRARPAPPTARREGRDRDRTARERPGRSRSASTSPIAPASRSAGSCASASRRSDDAACSTALARLRRACLEVRGLQQRGRPASGGAAAAEPTPSGVLAVGDPRERILDLRAKGGACAGCSRDGDSGERRCCGGGADAFGGSRGRESA